MPVIRLLRAADLGAFSWRWPAGLEHFSHGWAAVAEIDGAEVHVRHGIGGREAYGRYRTHSVTWVENDPTVEGVEADDFARSGALLSLVKLTKKHLRRDHGVPSAYRGFDVVVMADEVKGPYSPASLAVKLRHDDIEGWTRHALLRASAWGRIGAPARDRASLPPPTSAGPAPALELHGEIWEQRAAVVEALIAFAATQTAPEEGVPIAFTPVSEANALLRDDPFAFLCAVIFDQGVPAERAWIAPFLLRQRLGHLDPIRMAKDSDAVAAAIATTPKLHRYIGKLPGWIVSAAQRVVSLYGGDASKIWSDNPRADELQRRFDAFRGIGQKKAAMAVDILSREMEVPVRRLEGNDIAYDVHIRRVFLRTRLADRDDADHMIAVARRLYPRRPSTLDRPTWRVGRGWCHPGLPNCAACPLTEVCAKDIERSAHVTSA